MRRVCTYSSLYRLLDDVQTPNGIQASNDHLFKGAEFPRDEMEVCFQLLPWLRSLPRRSIFSILGRQGRVFNPVTEEELGKIFHEFRQRFVGAEQAGPEVIAILHELAERWGGTDDYLCYYGAIDTTPNIIRLVGEYVAWEGDDILDIQLQHAVTGEVLPVSEAVLMAADFVMRRTTSSDLGLLEFQRFNPKGHRWQVMRDGHTSYMHEDGELANVDAPIASLEIQGLAFRALHWANRLFPDHAQADDWLEQAETIRNTTLDMFWLDDRGYFAQFIDRTSDSRLRKGTMETSLPAELLELDFFDGLPEQEQKLYVGSIVRQTFSDQFVTPVGFRPRALRYHTLTPYDEYQASTVCWTIMADKFARGLRAEAMGPLALDIEDRFISGFERSGQIREFWYVGPDGKVYYFLSRHNPRAAGKILGTNIPENAQAWSIGAALRATLAQDPAVTPQPPPPTGWRKDLCDEVLQKLQDADSAEVDTERAQQLERKTFGDY